MEKFGWWEKYDLKLRKMLAKNNFAFLLFGKTRNSASKILWLYFSFNVQIGLVLSHNLLTIFFLQKQNLNYGQSSEIT